jgi:acetyl esterase
MVTRVEEHGDEVADWEPKDCDPELLAFLAEQAQLMGGRAYHQMTIEEARQAHRRACRTRIASLTAKPPIASFVDKSFDFKSSPVKVRIYSPLAKPPVPVVIFFHGGGWVFGDIETYDETARMICAAAKVIVVSVEYLLAPEHRFPEPLLCCVEAVRWTKENIGSLGGDADSVILMGDSAGGNLSAAAALACTRQGLEVAGQVVAYGPLAHIDHTEASGVQPWTKRRQRFGPTFASTAWYWGNYVEKPESGADPRASVLLDPDMRGAPPAIICAGNLDTYAEECLLYSRLLRDTGIPVKATVYSGLTHGFINHGWLPRAVRSEKAHVAALELCADVHNLAYSGSVSSLV